MTPAEYESLPANLQRDVRVALACGYGWERIRFVPKYACMFRPDRLYVQNDPRLDQRGGPPISITGWQRWQPTTDTTIWTALMDCGSGMHLSPYGCALWRANYGDGNPNTDLCGPTKGEAVCACFVAADPLGHLGRAGV